MTAVAIQDAWKGTGIEVSRLCFGALTIGLLRTNLSL